MREALNEAFDGIRQKHGGPFGAVIVRDGKILGRGHNMVLVNSDPTAHGEITAIRNACNNSGSYDLSGCELYTTGQPCPMCLYACMWANIKKIYYGCTIDDNAVIGFRDKSFYEGGDSSPELIGIDREACMELFESYLASEHDLY